MNDFRLALRQLATRPGFTAVVVLTLALGIGATTAIFSMVNAVLLAPLPYPQPDKLVQVYEMPVPGARNSVSGGAYKDWKANATRFEHLAIAQQVRRNFTGEQSPADIPGLRVSSEFLDVFGIEPALGRGFIAGEDSVGGNNRVVVLTHGLWQRRFGGDPDLLGTSVTLNQVGHTVIGILPPNTLIFDDREFLVPVVIDADPEAWQRAGHWSAVFGRLAPGAEAAEARAELHGIKQRLNDLYPSWKQDWSVGVAPLREMFAGPVRQTLLVLFGAVAFVLLIACANVSNLLLARGQSRAREMAVRAALGASRGRVIRQVLAESLVLAALGCVLGLGLAVAGMEILGMMVAERLPSMMRPELDLRVLAFSLATAGACGLLFGLLPALRAGSPHLAVTLKEGERGAVSGSRLRAQAALLVAQFAFSLVLLVGAGLFLRSFVHLADADPGFTPADTLAFDLSLPAAKYPDDRDRNRFVQTLSDRLETLPGVQAVGSATALPLSGRGQTETGYPSDQPPSHDYLLGVDWIGGDYFAAMDIPLQRGRVLDATDNRPDAPPAVVINTRIAQDLYPGDNPVGRRLHVLGVDWEIVGVVDSVRHFGMHIEATPRVYAPRARRGLPPSIIMRTGQDPMSLAGAARQAVLSLDPDQPITNIRTLEQATFAAVAPQRTTLILVGVFALVAVTLACIGIYGVMAYMIGLRSRELSIRAALGARRGDIMKRVMAGGMKSAGLGIVFGLGAALLLAGLAESLLFEVNARDPLVFAGAMAGLALMAMLSVWIPARRAAGADPATALRDE